MCGFAGYLAKAEQSKYPEKLLSKMGTAIRHRGPDDAGQWWDLDAGIGLCHQRLSILDLSQAGHQPMSSESGRYVIVFNGEIYNHQELRSEIDSTSDLPSNWRGHSDTETLLRGFEQFGIKATLEKSEGMFAFAVWDRQLRKLSLARDRLGEKPLYYGWQGTGNTSTFLFGSELKALKAHPQFESVINRDAIALQMRHNYIPTPYSIWQGINKLQPGCLATLSRDEPEPVIESYWSAKTVVETGIDSQFSGTTDEAISQLENILLDTVGQQMLADVPLGAFLSGGVDSSTIVAMMQAQSSQKVRTFSIGFSAANYNEAEHAKAVAHHLGTNHTELYVSPKDAMNVIPSLSSIYDEPFSDSSQIPTYLVSQMARQEVKVALSGDGGDELFCGYNRYLMTDRAWSKLSRLPVCLRQGLANGLTSLSPSTWNMLAQPLAKLWANRATGLNIGDKIHKSASVIGAHSSSELYRRLVSHWDKPSDLVIGANEPDTVLSKPFLQPRTTRHIEKMMAMDMLNYLPDDILVKVDRAAMAVSLETRVPFLNHRIVEFAWKLPLDFKLKGNEGKWILRQVLYKHVPRQLIERPKMGFGVPIGDWLRGPLKEWADDLLAEHRLRNEGFFNSQMVKEKWEQHISGKRNWQYLLWDILMFQSWHSEQSMQ